MLKISINQSTTYLFIISMLKWFFYIPFTAASKSCSELKLDKAACTRGWEASVEAGILKKTMSEVSKQ